MFIFKQAQHNVVESLEKITELLLADTDENDEPTVIKSEGEIVYNYLINILIIFHIAFILEHHY